ncbi:hypothetical protein QBC39DRAFT_168739 [Podospora conica]|nr:hypothetical protein QBC39DRAFT_168739 [Schizothecium conicum]
MSSLAGNTTMATENTTLPCGDLDSLVYALAETTLDQHARQLNVTYELLRCPQMCADAWGQSNPDFSGIGMNISYIFQAVLTILLGPCLYAVYGFLPNKSQAKIRAIHLEFFVTTLVLWVSITVATFLYRYSIFDKQILEFPFLHYLNAMQLLAFLTVSSTVFLLDYDAFDLIIVFIVIFVSHIVIFILTFLFPMPPTSFAFLGLLLTCTNYGTGISESTATAELERSLDLARTYEAEWFMPEESIVTYSIVYTVVFFILLLVLTFGTRLPPRLRYHKQLNALFPVGTSAGMIGFLVRMERSRSVLRKLSGSEYTSDEWGFGQIVVIFLWALTTVRLVKFLWELARRAVVPTSPLPDLEAADPEAADLPQALLVRRKTA